MILGIDVGGTHTDAVLLDHFKIRRKAKVLTDADNLLQSLLKVTQELLHDQDPQQLERVVLSTTVSTNAIVQKKTDRAGMVLANGPGIGPERLAVGDDCHFVAGYVNHRGLEAAPVDDDEIGRVGEHFRTLGIDRIGIVGKFSTRNPVQEIRIRDCLQNLSTHLSLGHRMSGHLNFPRRVATTYLNASVARIYGRFVEGVLDFVRQQGISVPIYILKADGGTLDIRQSIEFPVQNILSGPAASIMGIIGIAGGKQDAVALDIGGTTTDIAVLAEGVPLLEAFGVKIEGYKTLIRGLRTKSIGLGGDSCVRIEQGRLTIGPDREGPAAAFGGPCATPTDAMIVLGLTDIGLRDKAHEALLPLARQLQCSVNDTARQIFEKACRVIVDQIGSVIEEINDQPVYTIHEMLEGKQLQPKVLYVVGGPAGPMAPRLGEMLNCPVIIPAHAEVANAVGAALARTTAEVTVLADTEQRILSVAEEGYRTTIPQRFSLEDTIQVGRRILREKAIRMGANEEDLEIEVVESQAFNMVNQFYTSGKNIRVKLQVKPGLIAGFRAGEPL
jgi:N-methylhydantoinase A/oxoprolinase/acetone carboxylase beta subunit